MKLLRFGAPGEERPGLLGDDGHIRDLSSVIDDLSGKNLDPVQLARLRALDVSTLPVVSGDTRLGPPIDGTRNFVGIGLNYSDHAKEAGKNPPDEPIIFLKAVGSICGPNDDTVLPAESMKSDWEVEFAIVIGRTARNVSKEDALGYVAGYCICNDISERAWQSERGGTWDKGKSFDTFGPLGPWLVTTDEITDPTNLAMFLDVDCARMQTGNTSSMIFGVEELVSYTSQCLTLFPGDVISTGTPPGIGLAKKPQVFLRPGQTMHLGIEGLGEQKQRVRAFEDRQVK
ncbi:ureidoglycolate lyase [Neorhizobium galegae]|uniref:fumarylacetoacetate hydrolase family protein n=1 Tax=Neorhizobium galegae TaxID=399 RepID=UPI00277F6D69|nr:fumarylacetoacetate hydrolase family protein [Neorhizobium galegae]MDQ0137779.1 ureidoglycolate lyase [Neorhizobium galegae]